MGSYVRGDARAFEELFDRYAARLHAFFSRSFRSSAIADDLVQVTFLKAHSARATYRTELPVRPWIFGIAARVRIDELRRRYRAKEVGDEGVTEALQSEGPGPDEHLASSQMAAHVRRALESLPEGQRIVVHLHRFEGLSFGEIAAVLSTAEEKPLTEVAVRVRAFRAYDALRRILAEYVLEVGAGAPHETPEEHS